MSSVLPIDHKVTSFDFDTALGGFVVWSLFGRPGEFTFNVVNVVGLAFGLDHPHWDRGILEVAFVEVENHFLTC